MRRIRFSLLPGLHAVARLAPDAPVPVWAFDRPGFASVTRTADELSVVGPEGAAPEGTRVEGGWRVVKLHGPFAFDEVGILASFAAPLARRGVGIFALSTFDTDYVLVKASQVDEALEALAGAGHVHVP